MTRYQFSPGQIDIFVNGTLGSEVLSELFDTIARDAHFRCGLKQFWHFQEVDCSNFKSSCMANIGSVLLDNAKQRCPQVAFVAQSDLLYGLCRAYAGWIDPECVELGVFRSYEDALAWVYPAVEAQDLAQPRGGSVKG